MYWCKLVYNHLSVLPLKRDVTKRTSPSEERKTRIRRHTGESKMGKIEVGKLNRDDLFEYKGVIYMTGWSVRCRYVNDKNHYGSLL